MGVSPETDQDGTAKLGDERTDDVVGLMSELPRFISPESVEELLGCTPHVAQRIVRSFAIPGIGGPRSPRAPRKALTHLILLGLDAHESGVAEGRAQAAAEASRLAKEQLREAVAGELEDWRTEFLQIESRVRRHISERFNAINRRWEAAVEHRGNVRTSIPWSTRETVIARDGHKCRYCGKRVNKNNRQIDHVTPVSLGGTNDADNLVVACRNCNYDKGPLTLAQAEMELLPTP